jgi:hypothetical protein
LKRRRRWKRKRRQKKRRGRRRRRLGQEKKAQKGKGEISTRREMRRGGRVQMEVEKVGNEGGREN